MLLMLNQRKARWASMFHIGELTSAISFTDSHV